MQSSRRKIASAAKRAIEEARRRYIEVKEEMERAQGKAEALQEGKERERDVAKSLRLEVRRRISQTYRRPTPIRFCCQLRSDF